MNSPDIRWIQRFDNFKRAFARLSEGSELARQRDLPELERQGLIQAFEFTHELAWKTLKNFLTAAVRPRNSMDRGTPPAQPSLRS